MVTENVGAGILNIITESLYDKPIVVFREYVQNSVDSFLKTMSSVCKTQFSCRIWTEHNDLYFLDNGNGINRDRFLSEMKDIAYSRKMRTLNIGYKGIGRLSGISYCEKLIFINVISYKENYYQTYSIDCQNYNKIKREDIYSSLSFRDLMEKIGKLEDPAEDIFQNEIKEILAKYNEMFLIQDKGFLVILKNYNSILEQAISEKDIYEELGWLLPVGFKESIYETDEKLKLLFEDLSMSNEGGSIPAIGFDIYYNDIPIKRPIESEMLRDYTCFCDLKYGVGFHSFRRDRIAVEKGNTFSGIKMYIDNMLLCDETELIPILQKYSMLDHTTNELVQSVKGIGAMIYITDKINISANARRTFIEVTSGDAIDFLERVAEFIERIYKARYALSKYNSGKKNIELKAERLNELKEIANEALKALAEDEISVDYQENDEKLNFGNLSETEKKQIIKKKISKEINEQIRIYLSQATKFDYDSAYEDFKLWIKSN